MKTGLPFESFSRDLGTLVRDFLVTEEMEGGALTPQQIEALTPLVRSAIDTVQVTTDAEEVHLSQVVKQVIGSVLTLNTCTALFSQLGGLDYERTQQRVGDAFGAIAAPPLSESPPLELMQLPVPGVSWAEGNITEFPSDISIVSVGEPGCPFPKEYQKWMDLRGSRALPPSIIERVSQMREQDRASSTQAEREKQEKGPFAVSLSTGFRRYREGPLAVIILREKRWVAKAPLKDAEIFARVLNEILEAARGLPILANRKGPKRVVLPRVPNDANSYQVGKMMREKLDQFQTDHKGEFEFVIALSKDMHRSVGWSFESERDLFLSGWNGE